MDEIQFFAIHNAGKYLQKRREEKRIKQIKIDMSVTLIFLAAFILLVMFY